MTLTELIEQKNEVKQKIADLLKVAEDAERELTEEEQKTYDEMVAQLEGIEKEIGDKENELRSLKFKTPKNVNKRFSILNCINAEVNKRSLSDYENEVLNEGRSQMNKANLPTTGSIILPLNYRGSIQATVTGAGVENVETDKLEIISKLRNKLVLVEAGAQYLTNLVGNVSIPVYSGSDVGWSTENGEATDAAGGFTQVNYTPKRLTANLKISKQFLLQDANDAENLLRNDLINAISEKLESTLLGTSAGSSTQPAGLGNILSTPTEIAAYADVIGLEGALESSNVYNYSYLLSPSMKAALRTMPKATGQAVFVYDNGEISGYKANSSNAVPTDYGYIGDWSDYVIAQWGGIDIVVDQYTLASQGLIRLVINTYFDGKPRRSSSFKNFTLK
jgi:HK97 family phage major capsid protein